MRDAANPRPGYLGQLISRQAARPTGLLGRFIGRVMVKDTRTTNEAALELLDPQPGERILELGFGQGRTITQLVRMGATVVGVEVSETMRAQAAARSRRAIADGRVELLVGDGVTLPLDDDIADGAITAHTIYFWPQPDVTMSEVRRVLRPGARFVIAFRAGEAEIPSRLDPAVYDFRTTDDVVGLLADAGFADVDVHRRPQVSPDYRWIHATNPS